jgi:hypothetical protein
MGFREASLLKFLLVPETFCDCLAQCNLTESSLEGHSTDARAVRTT